VTVFGVYLWISLLCLPFAVGDIRTESRAARANTAAPTGIPYVRRWIRMVICMAPVYPLVALSAVGAAWIRHTQHGYHYLPRLLRYTRHIQRGGVPWGMRRTRTSIISELSGGCRRASRILVGIGEGRLWGPMRPPWEVYHDLGVFRVEWPFEAEDHTTRVQCALCGTTHTAVECWVEVHDEDDANVHVCTTCMDAIIERHLQANPVLPIPSHLRP
jgi:hypothetical protein